MPDATTADCDCVGEVHDRSQCTAEQRPVRCDCCAQVRAIVDEDVMDEWDAAGKLDRIYCLFHPDDNGASEVLRG